MLPTFVSDIETPKLHLRETSSVKEYSVFFLRFNNFVKGEIETWKDRYAVQY